MFGHNTRCACLIFEKYRWEYDPSMFLQNTSLVKIRLAYKGSSGLQFVTMPHTQENGFFLRSSDHIHKLHPFSDQTGPDILVTWTVVKLILGLVLKHIILPISSQDLFYVICPRIASFQKKNWRRSRRSRSGLEGKMLESSCSWADTWWWVLGFRYLSFLMLSVLWLMLFDYHQRNCHQESGTSGRRPVQFFSGTQFWEN